jgi:long-chain fatty acid transport protein
MTKTEWMPGHCQFIIGLCLAAVLLYVGAAQAGGLYLQSEFGTPSMGTAGAGAEAIAGSAGTAFHNPAGMTRLENRELLLGAGFVTGNAKFDADSTTPVSGGNGGNAAGFAPILGTFYVHPLTDKLWFGAAFTSISGAVLDYDNDWAGRFLVQEVSLITLSLMPSLAYKVNDWLSIGAGPVLTYGALEFDVAVPPPSGTGKVKIEDADDFQVAFKAGVLITLSKNTRIGITYQSETELDFEGDVKIDPFGAQAGLSTKIPFPQFVRASIFHRVNPYFALLASVNWEEWSKFDTQVISTSQGSINIKRKFKDTYGIRGGVIINPHEKWIFGAGIG